MISFSTNNILCTFVPVEEKTFHVWGTGLGLAVAYMFSSLFWRISFLNLFFRQIGPGLMSLSFVMGHMITEPHKTKPIARKQSKPKQNRG